MWATAGKCAEWLFTSGINLNYIIGGPHVEF